MPFEEEKLDDSTPITAAVVLAGGLGTRLRSVVSDVPKPMAPINGKPFLEYQLDYWIAQGVNHFVLSVGYRNEVIYGHFAESYRGVKIQYAIESEPMGTGGGLLLAASKLEAHKSFLVLNGDTFFEVQLEKLRGFHRQHHSMWTFSLFRTNETKRYMGMNISERGEVVSLQAGQDKSTNVLANGGVYLVDQRVLEICEKSAGQKASLEDDILLDLLGKKVGLYGYECDGRFIDIGVPTDYFRAAEILN